MNTKRFSLALVAACLSLSVADQASAYYAAHMGRFTSRDPNGEVGRFGIGTPPSSGAAVSFVARDQYDVMAQYNDGMNLHQYTGANPLIRTDPSGLLFGWGYGIFCGWSRRGPGVPIDSLDKACQDHDQCQCTWWTANPIHLVYCSTKLCTDADEASDSGCAADYPGNPQKVRECQEAASQVKLLFCGLAGGFDPDRDYSNPWHWSPGKL